MFNCHCGKQNLSSYTKIDPSDGSYVSAPMPDGTSDFALMANLLVSQGRPGKVLRVEAKQRTGEHNFTDAIRAALLHHYGPNRPVSFGGVFLLRQGQANLHVMVRFPRLSLLAFQDGK